ncbi:tetratricopeptide repeat protein [Desulfohalovibrio reitneri]|uniref:tetratricopeptide repeat protein n=1 Tax=Desulfohalovibrio reitneri TaxID=1307759 RepID=UPI0004A710F8|nr:tetratricopeptide repeat protein [Desulfohalovibrio reitneri]
MTHGFDAGFKGAFSISSASRVGEGATKRKNVQVFYVLAEKRQDGQFDVRYLNDNSVPSGNSWRVPEEDFLRQYTPEPDLYHNAVYPAMRSLEKTIAKADRYRDNKQSFSAEMEYKKALRIDEDNVRATFGFGLNYLDRGDTEKADLVFRRLVRLNAAFEPEHKHLFNEFGIKLRKAGLFSQAVKYYARARQFTKDDENLLYNFARALHAKGRSDRAVHFLERALEMRPDFPEAKGFLKYLVKPRGEESEGERDFGRDIFLEEDW